MTVLLRTSRLHNAVQDRQAGGGAGRPRRASPSLPRSPDMSAPPQIRALVVVLPTLGAGQLELVFQSAALRILVRVSLPCTDPAERAQPADRGAAAALGRRGATATSMRPRSGRCSRRWARTPRKSSGRSSRSGQPAAAQPGVRK